VRLYHVSERSGIAVFHPRPAKKTVWPAMTGRYVWAVSEETVHNYLLPRECPRVCWTPGPRTSEAEKRAFDDAGGQVAIIAVELAWMDAIGRCILWRYELDPARFAPLDSDAGYYCSEHEERPLAVTALRDPPALLAAARVSLIARDDLEPLRAAIASSGYRFSNIKMSNLGKGPAAAPALDGGGPID
jgi:hypothetical protein